MIKRKFLSEQYNIKKNKVGRPTKYKPEYCQAIIDYFQNCRTNNKPAWLIDFALSIGTQTQSLEDWCKRDKNFLQSYNIAKEIQTAQIASMGLTNQWNASFCFNALKNVSHWRDKTQTEMSGGTADSLEISVVYTKPPQSQSGN